MRVAIDLDGVIWDFHTPFLNLYNQEYDENIQYENVNKWDFVPRERWEYIYKKTMQRPYSFMLIDLAIPQYLKILNQYYDVSILTHGNYSILDLEKYLKKLGMRGGRNFNELIVANISVPKTNLDYDIYVDDNPNMVKDFLEHPKKYLLLFGQPWNRNSFMPKNVSRIQNWKDIMSFFLEKKDKKLIKKRK